MKAFLLTRCFWLVFSLLFSDVCGSSFHYNACCDNRVRAKLPWRLGTSGVSGGMEAVGASLFLIVRIPFLLLRRRQTTNTYKITSMCRKYLQSKIYANSFKINATPTWLSADVSNLASIHPLVCASLQGYSDLEWPWPTCAPSCMLPVRLHQEPMRTAKPQAQQ